MIPVSQLREVVLFRPERTSDTTFVLGVFSSQRGGRLEIAIPAQSASGRLPFAYQFVAATEVRPHPLLIVVAAPGVSINDPDRLLERTPGPATPEVLVVRVQDPALVPPIGSDLSAANLLARGDVNRPPFWSEERVAQIVAEGGIAMTPVRFFTVERVPEGIIIGQPATAQSVAIRVPQVFRIRPPSGLLRNRRPQDFEFDSTARFAYELLPDGEEDDEDHRPILKIVITPQVTVAVRRGRIPSPRWYTGPPPPQRSFWRVWEVDDLAQVPVQGAPIVPERGWRRASVTNEEPPQEALAKAALDVTIGAIPVVGDLVDIAEFVLAAVAGIDRWGRPVGRADLSLMAMGAMLPFVSSPVLRSGKKLVDVFGEHAGDAGRLIDRIREAGGLNQQEIARIAEMADLLRAGRAPTAAMWQEYATVVRRFGSEPPVIDELLNADRSGFLHAELQEAYQRYRQRRLREGATPADPVTWASRTSGRPLELLRSVLGEDFARPVARVRDIPVRLGNVPQPPRYANPDALNADLTKLQGQRHKLWERLDALLDEIRQARAAGSSATVGRGRFGILKGNVAEVLSLDIQWQILRQIAQRNPDAVLISGVRVRRVVRGRVREELFSDNIIATVKDGRLEVLGVIEVKAGREGDRTVTLQIFEWIEEKLDEGAQVVLAAGSRTMNADGVVRQIDRQLTYTWHPSRADVPTVVGLASAERHRITAKGVSTLGIDSEYQTSARVTPHALEQSSEELDYLSAILLRREGAGWP